MITISQMPDLNLKLFRNQVYHCLGNAKDAVFELTDAAILTRSPESLAELSLSPIFRRQWHSTYEALEDCNPSRDEMMTIYTQQIALNSRPIGVGFGYSTIAYIPEKQGSWALPLLHERISSGETAIAKLSSQLTQVCTQLEPRAILLVDSQYGCASFVQQTANISCDKENSVTDGVI